MEFEMVNREKEVLHEVAEEYFEMVEVFEAEEKNNVTSIENVEKVEAPIKLMKRLPVPEKKKESFLEYLIRENGHITLREVELVRKEMKESWQDGRFSYYVGFYIMLLVALGQSWWLLKSLFMTKLMVMGYLAYCFLITKIKEEIRKAAELEKEKLEEERHMSRLEENQRRIEAARRIGKTLDKKDFL